MKRTLFAVGIIAMLTVGGAFAATNTGNVNVTATVANNCTITAGAVNFGAYDPIGANLAADLDQTGSLTVQCTKSATPSGVALGVGSNAGLGSYGTRAMSNGTDHLGYELFTTSTRNTVWNAANMMTPAGPFGVTHTSTMTIYGRVGKAQDVSAGSYTDSVVATINF